MWSIGTGRPKSFNASSLPSPISTKMIIPLKQVSDWQSPMSLLSPLPFHVLEWGSGPFDLPGGPEYLQCDERPFAGGPFQASASDSSWDMGDDTSSVESEDLTSTFNEPCFPGSISPLNRGGIEIVAVVGSNALGLEFTSEVDDVLRLESKVIPTSRPQAESLRAPHSHQDNRSCDISTRSTMLCKSIWHTSPRVKPTNSKR
ncbi:hypothetical protein BC827DRAFT_854389 [Russula dissimulans]|nr:hypothetical protein BC827DRAFT_854389 [Russula dissimulans]